MGACETVCLLINPPIVSNYPWPLKSAISRFPLLFLHYRLPHITISSTCPTYLITLFPLVYCCLIRFASKESASVVSVNLIHTFAQQNYAHSRPLVSTFIVQLVPNNRKMCIIIRLAMFTYLRASPRHKYGHYLFKQAAWGGSGNGKLGDGEILKCWKNRCCYYCCKTK